MKNARQRIYRLLGLTLAALVASEGWAAPIAISNTQPLAFGKFAAGLGGSVTVSPAGARSAGGAVVLVASGGASPALFSVSGDPNLTYAISLPANGTVSLAAGANTMTVSNFTSSPSPIGQLSAGGTQTLSVGATLSVGSNQPTGNYLSSFDVFVDYN